MFYFCTVLYITSNIDSVMFETFPINRMKEGLEGLSPLPTGPAPTPQGLWKTQGPLSLGAPGLALLGDWPPGRGPGWAKLCILEKKSPPPSLGGNRDLGLGGRGRGRCPSSEPILPPGWGTNPSLIARMPPACAGGQGRPQKQQGKKGLDPPGGEESLSCGEGEGRLRNHQNK